MPRIIGYGAFSAVALAAYEFTGGTLKGYLNRPEMDEYERKELLRKNRRRPIEETIAEIGEGRGGFPLPARRRPRFLLQTID
jgi:putative N-acetylmannosamine-6-phosphate epimerase